MDNSKLVSDLSGILEGLDSSQEQLEKDAFDVINSSDTSLNLVKESISSVEEILKMITELNEIAEESASRIKELEKLSKDIEQFAGVIASISSRTNILSLNASIEAARAGESGKGFAVVANQVNVLADQSAQAAKESATLIETSVKAVEKGMVIAGQTAAQLEEVEENSKVITTEVTNIAETLETQTTEIKQIDEGIEQINDVVQTNSATSEECAAASQEMSSEAESLQGMIQKFKIPETENVTE